MSSNGKPFRTLDSAGGTMYFTTQEEAHAHATEQAANTGKWVGVESYDLHSSDDELNFGWGLIGSAGADPAKPEGFFITSPPRVPGIPGIVTASYRLPDDPWCVPSWIVMVARGKAGEQPGHFSTHLLGMHPSGVFYATSGHYDIATHVEAREDFLARVVKGL